MDIISERWFGRGKRRKFTAVFTIVAMLAGLAAIQLTSAPAGAQDIDETFELDANAQATSGLPDDWASILSGSANNTNTLLQADPVLRRVAQTKVPIQDFEETDVSYFKGGGSKDERNITGGNSHWLYSATDVAPDKNSILNAAAAAYKVPDGPADSNTNEDLVLDFTLDRLANDGDAVVGFWFFKDRVQTIPDTDDFSGVHIPGDLLVVSDFSKGGDVSKIRVYEWTGTKGAPIRLVAGNEQGDPTIPGGGDTVDCKPANATLTVNPYVCGTANKATETAIWDYQAKATGTPFKQYPPGSFYEGGININALIPGSDGCFASFMAMTRSSTSTTAQLKDFVLGDFPICAPSTTLSASPTTAEPEITVVGDTVTYSFVETNDGNVPLTNVYLTDDHASCNLSPSQANAVTLEVGATQTFTCSFASTAAGITEVTAIGHGTSEIGEVTYCDNPATTNVNECGAGQIHDPQEKATAKSVAIRPSTDIDIVANPTTVRVNDVVTYTITETNDGSAPTGYDSSLDLTSVSVGTGLTACDEDLGTHTGNTGDENVLSKNETWTYTCTVPALTAGTLTVTATGTGVVLAGTSRARTVTACGTGCTASQYGDADERASAPVTVINPSTSLNVTASASITYTFREANDAPIGDPALSPPTTGVRESVLSLAETTMCNVSAPVYASGDQATGTSSFKLDAGETWVFTCVGSLTGPTADAGTTSKLVTGIGDGIDATNRNVTFCSPSCTTSQRHDGQERDRVTVTIENHTQGAN